MLAVVVDTNVLLRAMIRAGDSDWQIYESFVEGNLKWFYSRKMLDEFLGILEYPRLAKRIDFGKVNKFLSPIIDFGILLISQSTEVCRDPDDNEILGVGLSAAKRHKLVYLITADQDLLELKGKVSEIKIMTAAQFVSRFRSKIT